MGAKTVQRDRAVQDYRERNQRGLQGIAGGDRTEIRVINDRKQSEKGDVSRPVRPVPHASPVVVATHFLLNADGWQTAPAAAAPVSPQTDPRDIEDRAISVV